MISEDSLALVTEASDQSERRDILAEALTLYRIDPGLALHRAAEATL